MTSDHHRRNQLVRALFLLAALLSFGLSVGLYFTGSENEGIFVGLWVPSILALGAFVAPRGEFGPHPHDPEAVTGAGR